MSDDFLSNPFYILGRIEAIIKDDTLKKTPLRRTPEKKVKAVKDVLVLWKFAMEKEKKKGNLFFMGGPLEG